MSLKFSTAPEASHLIRSRKGQLGTVSFGVDSTAPTLDYYVQFHDVSALPATPGSSAFLCAPLKVQHTLGVDDGPFVFDFEQEMCANGCAIILSTTRTTLTVAGAYLVLLGASGT